MGLGRRPGLAELRLGVLALGAGALELALQFLDPRLRGPRRSRRAVGPLLGGPQLGLDLAGARGGCGLALGRQLGLGGGHLCSQLLDLGARSARGLAQARELGGQLVLLGGRAGRGLAGGLQLGLRCLQVGARLDQLGLGARELAAKLVELALHLVRGGRVHRRARALVRERLSALRLRLPEHRGRRARPAGPTGLLRLRGGRQLPEQCIESGARRRGRLHLQLGHHGDVVHRERVGGVRHRHEQAAAHESNRHRAGIASRPTAGSARRRRGPPRSRPGRCTRAHSARRSPARAAPR